MSIDQDPQVFKLLVGIIGSYFVATGVLFLKMLFGLKDTDEKIFNRLNKLDEKVSKIEGKLDI